MTDHEIIDALEKSITSLDVVINHMELCDEAEEVECVGLNNVRIRLVSIIEHLMKAQSGDAR